MPTAPRHSINRGRRVRVRIFLSATVLGALGCFVGYFQASAEADKTLGILTQVVEDYCRDASEPWAAVHGVLANGKEFKLSDKRPALETSILTHVKIEKGRLTFEGFKKNGEPVEPHPGLFAKVALEVGDKLDSDALKKMGIDANRLAKDALANLDLTQSLHNQEWMLELLFRVGAADKQKAGAEKALKLLETEQSYIEPFLKNRSRSIETFEKKAHRVKGRPVADAIHRYYCGGTHLFHAVTLAISKDFLGADGKKRYAKQMQILLFRAQAESRYWDRQMGKVYEAKMSRGQRAYYLDLFYTQKLKILGHCLESWHKARLWKAYVASKDDHKYVVQITKELESTVEAIESRGLFRRIPQLQIKKQTRQMRRDLIGDSAHALYGLKLGARK
jgi:hypothetical protein